MVEARECVGAEFHTHTHDDGILQGCLEQWNMLNTPEAHTHNGDSSQKWSGLYTHSLPQALETVNTVP